MKIISNTFTPKSHREIIVLRYIEINVILKTTIYMHYHDYTNHFMHGDTSLLKKHQFKIKVHYWASVFKQLRDSNVYN